MITQTKEHIFTISEFARMTRGLLETHFKTIWIEGEISNFTMPRSGHWYFSLKDENAQIRCAMFRAYNSRIKFKPQDGMQILARVKVSFYEQRGDFQLIIEFLEEKGIGALQRAFEQLKLKLEKEGLFDNKYKKPLPSFPSCLGVITSPTGAAIRDILNVLSRRFPILPIIIYPTLVQGEMAAEQIAQMIKIANERQECDVLLLARGGGSLEDLWPFNEEIVARAIFKSKIPIISGIGHEVDFTMADFVADVRAPTPSAAAELMTPDQSDILNQLQKFKRQIYFDLKQNVLAKQENIKWLQKRLFQRHPKTVIEQQIQRCDQLEQSLVRAQNQMLKNFKQKLKELLRALNAVNPLSILDRGFAVVTNDQNKIITNSIQVQSGEKIITQLAKGKIKSIVE